MTNENQAAVTPQTRQPEWISVKERLPNTREKVLAWVVDERTIDDDGFEREPYTGPWVSEYRPELPLSVKAWKRVTHWQLIAAPDLAVVVPQPQAEKEIWPKNLPEKNEMECACCGAYNPCYLFACGWAYCWHCEDNRGRHDDCEICLARPVSDQPDRGNGENGVE